MRRLSPVDRVRAITAAVAGGTMAVAVLALLAAEAILVLGWLPGTAPILIAAAAGVAAWRAEEAVASRSAVRWAWGSSWRSFVITIFGVGLLLGVVVARASVGSHPAPDTDLADIGVYYAAILMFFYAPLPLLLGLAAHLLAALAIRRATHRWWSWFAG